LKNTNRANGDASCCPGCGQKVTICSPQNNERIFAVFIAENRWARAGEFADAMNAAYSLFGEEGLCEFDVDELLFPLSLNQHQYADPAGQNRPAEIVLAATWGLE
jgi:hypothetical protein